MNCPNCDTPHPDGEQFCAACGSELAGAVPAPATPDFTPTPTPAPPTPAPSTPAIATLSYGDKDFPLYEGGKFLIARKDSSKCTPDLGIDADDVSSTPVEVSVENGVITVRDTGTSIGTRIVKYLAPGEAMEVKPGEMIMLGNNVVIVS